MPMRCILIEFDGQGIETLQFDNLELAQATMQERFKVFTPEIITSDFEDFSYCDDRDARIRVSENEFYLWKIVEITI